MFGALGLRERLNRYLFLSKTFFFVLILCILYQDKSLWKRVEDGSKRDWWSPVLWLSIQHLKRHLIKSPTMRISIRTYVALGFFLESEFSFCFSQNLICELAGYFVNERASSQQFWILRSLELMAKQIFCQ